jgi:hypothetical protein
MQRAEFMPASNRRNSINRRHGGRPDIDLRRIDAGGMEDQHCLVERSEEAIDGLRICSVDEFSGVQHGRCEKDGYAVGALVSEPASQDAAFVAGCDRKIVPSFRFLPPEIRLPP